MNHLKTYEASNELDFEKLSKNKPNYKIGDYVKFIGIDKPGMDKDKIYIVVDITHEDTGHFGEPEYYYFTRLDNGFNLYSGKLRKLTSFELSQIKYNV